MKANQFDIIGDSGFHIRHGTQIQIKVCSGLMKQAILFIALFWLIPSGWLNAQQEQLKFSTVQLEYFETEIRPLLIKHCYECHSSKSKEIKGGLRVDARSLLLK